MKDNLEQRTNSSYHSDGIASPDHVRKHALDTFGTEEKALHWLRRPNQLLGGQTPLEALEIEPLAVEQELIRIDHGIFV